jgi:hypothetical protein
MLPTILIDGERKEERASVVWPAYQGVEMSTANARPTLWTIDGDVPPFVDI